MGTSLARAGTCLVILLVAAAVLATCNRPGVPAGTDSSRTAVSPARALSPSSAPPSASALVVRPAAPPASSERGSSPEVPPDAAPCQPPSYPLELLWLDEEYRTVVDRERLRCLSEPERAVVAYASALAGSGCDLASGADTTDLHYECLLTTALGLGYQCEAEHKAFIERWLPKDLPARCYSKPVTSTWQEVFAKLTLRTAGKRTTLVYEAHGTEGPGGRTWSWSDTLVFELNREGWLGIVRRRRTGHRTTL